MKFGGLGIRNPVAHADSAFVASKSGSSISVDSIRSGEQLCIFDHLSHVKYARANVQQQLMSEDKACLDFILGSVSDSTNRVIDRGIRWKNSNWLT